MSNAHNRMLEKYRTFRPDRCRGDEVEEGVVIPMFGAIGDEVDRIDMAPTRQHRVSRGLVIVTVCAWVVAVAIGVAAVLFSVGASASTAEAPRRGDWVCWWDSMETTCGTYGWSPSRQAAVDAARELCVSKCPTPCTFSYCEKLKR